jgi:hypothetical protein
VGAHFFADVDANNFRVPDLRNMFRRFTGTDADTANARLLGSRQIDAFRSHSHGLTAGPNNLQTSATPNANDVGRSGVTETGGSTQISGGTETRPLNTAYPPRIHA